MEGKVNGLRTFEKSLFDLIENLIVVSVSDRYCSILSQIKSEIGEVDNISTIDNNTLDIDQDDITSEITDKVFDLFPDLIHFFMSVEASRNHISTRVYRDFLMGVIDRVNSEIYSLGLYITMCDASDSLYINER